MVTDQFIELVLGHYMFNWELYFLGVGLAQWVARSTVNRGCVTGHIKDPVPLIGKKRGLSPSGRFPPRFIHRVIIVTGLNKL